MCIHAKEGESEVDVSAFLSAQTKIGSVAAFQMCNLGLIKRRKLEAHYWFYLRIIENVRNASLFN